jgi:putative MATE family efflux protein
MANGVSVLKDTQIQLTTKDNDRRDFILNGNMWRVVVQICTPLAIYQGLNQFFKFLDTMMAAHISSEAVSAVAYLSQISTLLGAIGTGLAVGGSITIASNYGAGNYKNVKNQVSTLMAMAIAIGGLILLMMIPFAEPILRFANMPPELIAVGRNYFIIELITVVVIFINTVYISIEKARGNTKTILYLNISVFTCKFLLTAFFIYILQSGVAMVAVASLVSQMVMMVYGFWCLRDGEQIFGFSLKSILFKKQITWPMIRLAIPIMTEKMAFSLGKVLVNAMSVMFGSTMVGALGVSNNIGGLTTSPPNGVQEGGASIISQNLGNHNLDRALDAFKKILIINLAIGTIGFVLTSIFMTPIINLFAKGDIHFAAEIRSIYGYERWGGVLLSITSSVMALLYGFGYTKISLLINFARVFVFRVPILYVLSNYTTLGSASVGYSMMLSNALIGLGSGVVGYIVIRKIKKQYASMEKGDKIHSI